MFLPEKKLHTAGLFCFIVIFKCLYSAAVKKVPPQAVRLLRGGRKVKDGPLLAK